MDMDVELSDDIYAKLVISARKNGRTVEEEAHAILVTHFSSGDPISDQNRKNLANLRKTKPGPALAMLILPMIAAAGLIAASAFSVAGALA